MCYPYATITYAAAEGFKKITICEFVGPNLVFFLFGIWSEALNEPVINTVFSNSGRYIRLGYKYAV